MVPSSFIGRSTEQVEEFIDDYIAPLRRENKDILGENAELSV